MFRPIIVAAGTLLAACLLVSPALAGSSSTRHVSSHGIALSYSASLARGVTVTSIGLRMSADGTIPARAAFFTGYTVPGNPYFPPSIWVVPTNLSHYRKVAGVIGKGGMVSQIAALRTLLRTHPKLSTVRSIPYVLPETDEAELLAAKKRYLGFGSGSGVSFVTVLSQPAITITNATPVRWEYRGLTRNGKYLVAAEFPLHVPGLLAKQPNLGLRQQAALIHGWKKYVAKMQRSLDRRANSSYGPPLGTLDALARTITITK